MISSQSRGFVPRQVKDGNRLLDVHSVGSLSDQSDKLRSVIDTTKLKKIDLLALSESHWRGNGVASICGTTILYLHSLFSSSLIFTVLPFFSVSN